MRVLDMFRKPVVKEFAGSPETATRADDIYARFGTRPYNPDLLASKKGGLRIYYEMRQDDQIKACLHLKKNAITMPGWKVEGEDENLTDFLEEVFKTMDGSMDQFVLSLLSAFDYGFSLHEKVYRMIEGGPYSGKIGLQALRAKSPTRITFEIDNYGRLIGIRQRQNTGIELPLDPEKFVLFTYQMEFDNYYGESDLKAAYKDYFLKANIKRYWAMYLERFSIPIAAGKSDLGNLTPAQKEEFKAIVANIQAGMSALLPNNMELEFLEPARSDRGIFDQAINACNISIARAVLIPQLLGLVSQGDVGSFAQAKTHSEIFNYILGGISKSVEETINEQLVKPLVVMNFGEQSEYPTFGFNPISDADKAAFVTAWSDAVSKGAVRTTPETEKYVREMLKFPELNEEEMAELEKQDEQKTMLDRARAEALARPTPPMATKRMSAEEAEAMWNKRIAELDDIEEAAREQLGAAFNASILGLIKDAKKKS